MQRQERLQTIIDARDHRPGFRFGDLWRSRYLIFLFARRSFVSTYRQTAFGPLWAFFSPVLNTFFFTVFFANFAKLPTMDAAPSGNVVLPSFLFYMVGNVLWAYFDSTVHGVSNTLLSNAQVMGKVYYPRLVSPISTTISEALTLLIHLAIFSLITAVCVLCGFAVIRPSPWVLLVFPVLILQLALLALGVGLAFASITTKYRDAMLILSFCMHLWHYASPTVYGMQMVSERWMGLYMLNPIVPVLTAARYFCFGEGYFAPAYSLLGGVTSIVVFFIGVFMFNWVEKSFIDTV